MLKIKDNVDLKELEKFGFKKYFDIQPTHRSKFSKEKYIDETYTETGYGIDDGCNSCFVVEKRKNSDWIHPNEERQIYVEELDYEEGVSMEMYDLIYDLIVAGLLEKVEDKK